MIPLWYEKVVEFVPRWVAPNLLTCLGFVCILLHWAVVAWFDYCFEGEAVPCWAWLSAAVLLFSYYTLDGIDGMQARRTKSSTPLGELLAGSWSRHLVLPFHYQHTLCSIREYFVWLHEVLSPLHKLSECVGYPLGEIQHRRDESSPRLPRSVTHHLHSLPTLRHGWTRALAGRATRQSLPHQLFSPRPRLLHRVFVCEGNLQCYLQHPSGRQGREREAVEAV